MSGAEQGPMLDAASILAASLAAPQPVYVREWGGVVYVREMSGAERDAFERAGLVNGAPSLENFRARLAVATVCDAAGRLLFEARQAPELGRASGRALQRIFEVAAPLNGITDEEVDALEKKSASTPSTLHG